MSGGKARRSAGRQQLDREVIVTAAIDLAATGETITFRALGSALGTDPTAVYRHFRDKEELMQAVVDRLIVAMLDQLDHDAPWRDQLRDGALAVDGHLRRPSPGRRRGVGHRDRRTGRAAGDQLDPDPAGAGRAGQGADRALLRGVLQLRPGRLGRPVAAAPLGGRDGTDLTLDRRPPSRGRRAAAGPGRAAARAGRPWPTATSTSPASRCSSTPSRSPRAARVRTRGA